MHVVFFQRKPGKTDFSIEILFNTIIAHLPPEVNSTISLSKYVNHGLYSKLYNMFEILFKKQGDINHVPGDVHYLTLFLKKKKTVLTIHDLNLLYTTNKIKQFIFKWFWFRLPVKRSQVVTVISKETKKELLKYVNCHPDKIKVIYNCISPAFTPHPKTFNKAKPTILLIGCRPNKNLTRVIEAVKDLACRLDIIGSPTTEQVALLDKYQLEYNTQSGLSEQEVIQKYIACDLLVFASLFEGFGLPIIEANAIERVVVTSNISSMPEVAGDAAYLVDPYDIHSIRNGITKVIQEDSLRERLIQNGRKNKLRFTAQQIANQYHDLYQQLLIPSKKKGPSTYTLAPN